MRRHELSNEQWERIQELLPVQTGPGHPWTDHRKILNGMFWILKTGAPWRDLLERYGPWQTVYDRFCRWQKDGTFDRILEALQIRLDRNGLIDWELWCVDGSSIRAHKSAAGAGKKGGAKSLKTTRWAAREAVGEVKSTWSLTVEAFPCLPKSVLDKSTSPPVLKR